AAPHVNTARFPAAATDLGELQDEGYPQPYPPVTTTVSYPAVSPMPLSPSGSSHGAYPTADWSSERPIIRPAAGSSMAAPPPPPDRRRTPMVMPQPAALGAEDLGIEESEFDKPTYLRRSLAAHDPGSR